MFSRVGAIYEHRLMMEQNGLNRGYAYVKFTNVQVSRVIVTQLVLNAKAGIIINLRNFNR